jgi:hypothetical protein
VYGNGPQILAGLVMEDRASIERVLETEEWQTLRDKLMTYLTTFQYKIVNHTGHFQL